MSHLKPLNCLLTPEQAGLPASVTREVNKDVQEALVRASNSKKQPLYTAEDRAAIRRYAVQMAMLANMVSVNNTLHLIQARALASHLSTRIATSHKEGGCAGRKVQI